MERRNSQGRGGKQAQIQSTRYALGEGDYGEGSFCSSPWYKLRAWPRPLDALSRRPGHGVFFSGVCNLSDQTGHDLFVGCKGISVPAKVSVWAKLGSKGRIHQKETLPLPASRGRYTLPTW